MDSLMNKYQGGNTNAEVDKQTMLDNITSQFYNLLNTQENVIGNIENKLHRIIDRQVPTKGEISARNELSNKEPDWNSRINAEITRLVNHNIALEKILKHLSEIV